jgi:chemotaxis signal transduction protein
MMGVARDSDESSGVGLLCLAGRARIVVPAHDILQVIEYPVSTRLPLAARFVGGLGLFEGRVIISVAIDPKRDGAVAQRLTKGLLVKRGSPRTAAWAIEVSQVRALVELSPEAVLGADHPDQASFVSWRKTREHELVGCIDVAAMIAELSHARASGLAS